MTKPRKPRIPGDIRFKDMWGNYFRTLLTNGGLILSYRDLGGILLDASDCRRLAAWLLRASAYLESKP